MMNDKIYKLIIFTVASLFIVSCKKVEDKFPPGCYQFDADMEEIGGEEEKFSTTFNVLLLESDESYLKIKFFVGDTLWDEPDLLTITNGKNVQGSFPARLNGDKPIIVESGTIIKKNRNEYIIEGSLKYEVLFDAGWDVYWRKCEGTYTFHPK